MSGMMIMIAGGLILALSTIVMVVIEIWVGKKKQRLREQTYQMY